jgi:hypothetical protein
MQEGGDLYCIFGFTQEQNVDIKTLFTEVKED